MRIAILTIFPEMFESVLGSSILGRAAGKSLVDDRAGGHPCLSATTSIKIPTITPSAAARAW